jgi:hypothetical protein
MGTVLLTAKIHCSGRLARLPGCAIEKMESDKLSTFYFPNLINQTKETNNIE